jgi:hypothetical protein
MVVINGVFHPELARQRSFKPFLEVVRGLVEEHDRLVFYRAFDYGAVFYSRRHIRPLKRLPVAADQRTWVLLWESEWAGLDDAERSRLELYHKSEGTGPKGRDALVLALVKPRDQNG